MIFYIYIFYTPIKYSQLPQLQYVGDFDLIHHLIMIMVIIMIMMIHFGFNHFIITLQHE